jgi:hypothetical protein
MNTIWQRLFALVGTSLPLRGFLWLNKKATDEYARNAKKGR